MQACDKADYQTEIYAHLAAYDSDFNRMTAPPVSGLNLRFNK